MDLVVGFRKPTGITSNDFLTRVKRQLGRWRIRTSGKHRVKVGHGGTLDKGAEGVLVVGLGKGTKRMSEMLKGNKVYIGTGRFGSATDTDDGSGTSIQTMDPETDHPTQQLLEDMLAGMVGENMQVPPVYSALKKKGVRYSDLAREGKVVTPPARRVVFNSLELINYDWPNFTIRVSCSGGTYIRALIRDIGEMTECYAHMTHLVRTDQGGFRLEDCFDLDNDESVIRLQKTVLGQSKD